MHTGITNDEATSGQLAKPSPPVKLPSKWCTCMCVCVEVRVLLLLFVYLLCALHIVVYVYSFMISLVIMASPWTVCSRSDLWDLYKIDKKLISGKPSATLCIHSVIS